MSRKRRRAFLSGCADYYPADVTLTRWDGAQWVGLANYVSEDGCYSNRVRAGYYWNYYVSAQVTSGVSIIGLGTFPCRQTWADWSGYVKARRGRTYNNLNTYLQNTSGSNCAYP
jgi:hypothetical protein